MKIYLEQLPAVQASEYLELADISIVGNSVTYKRDTVNTLMRNMRNNATKGIERRRAPQPTDAQLELMGITVVRSGKPTKE